MPICVLADDSLELFSQYVYWLTNVCIDRSRIGVPGKGSVSVFGCAFVWLCHLPKSWHFEVPPDSRCWRRCVVRHYSDRFWSMVQDLSKMRVVLGTTRVRLSRVRQFFASTNWCIRRQCHWRHQRGGRQCLDWRPICALVANVGIGAFRICPICVLDANVGVGVTNEGDGNVWSASNLCIGHQRRTWCVPTQCWPICELATSKDLVQCHCRN